MKKLLCVFGIIGLLFLILFPPMLKILLPDVNENDKEVVEVKKVSLMCTSDNFATSTTYSNDKINMIIIKKIVKSNDENLDEASSEIEEGLLPKIFNGLKDSDEINLKELEDGEAISIDFNENDHSNLDINDLTQKIENQKSFYEQEGLNCSVLD